jgi:integrator complex subunit 9
LKYTYAFHIQELNTRYFIDSPPEVSRPEISMMDLSEVDAILISNYHHMLALPYITEYTDFKGTRALKALPYI